MRNRFQTVVAVVAIALQALDAVVGSLGHSHADAAVEVHDSACCHHGHEAPLPASPADDEHDDCSLCRHFSQPVAPVALIAEVQQCERVEAFVPAFIAAVDAVFTSTHLARGPPTASA